MGGGERNSNRATGYNSAPVTLRPGQVHPAIKDRGVGCQRVRGRGMVMKGVQNSDVNIVQIGMQVSKGCPFITYSN